MECPYFQVDAFTRNLFKGNAAGVCLLPTWPRDDLLLSMAQEHHLAETAFIVFDNGLLRLRWFTPELEMDLCGHATLAAAHVILSEKRAQVWLAHHGLSITDTVQFHTLSGLLTVSTLDPKSAILSYILDFPQRPPIMVNEWETDPQIKLIIKALGHSPVEVWRARDILCLFEESIEVHHLNPDPLLMAQVDLGTGGVVVTANGVSELILDHTGQRPDFISRFFTPQAELFEDDVTGSAHCTLGPFWSQRLQLDNLLAYQASKRGGWLRLKCHRSSEESGPDIDRIWISGEAVTYLKGTVNIAIGD